MQGNLKDRLNLILRLKDYQEMSVSLSQVILNLHKQSTMSVGTSLATARN